MERVQRRSRLVTWDSSDETRTDRSGVRNGYQRYATTAERVMAIVIRGIRMVIS